MTARSTIRALLLLAAGAAAAACGSSGSSGPSFSGTISDSAAAAAAANTEDFSGNLIYAFGFGGTAVGFAPQASPRAVALLNAAWMTAAHTRVPRYTVKGMAAPPVLDLAGAAGCNGGQVATTSGDTTDADNDGIPANETTTLSCDTTYSNGSTLSIHGSINLRDVPGLYGFQFSATLTEVLTDSAHNSIRTSITAAEDAAFTASLAKDSADVTASEAVNDHGVTTGDGTRYHWAATFTPSAASLAVGSPLPDGALHFSGGFYVLDLANAANNFNFTMATAIDLQYSAACAGQSDPFTSGVVIGLLNGLTDVGFTANYENGCNHAPTVVGHGNAT